MKLLLGLIGILKETLSLLVAAILFQYSILEALKLLNPLFLRLMKVCIRFPVKKIIVMKLRLFLSEMES